MQRSTLLPRCLTRKVRIDLSHLQLFFGILSVVMLGVRYKSDNRDKFIQHGSWLLKTGLWVLCNILPFLLPVGLVNSYGKRAGYPHSHIVYTPGCIVQTQGT